MGGIRRDLYLYILKSRQYRRHNTQTNDVDPTKYRKQNKIFYLNSKLKKKRIAYESNQPTKQFYMEKILTFCNIILFYLRSKNPFNGLQSIT